MKEDGQNYYLEKIVVPGKLRENQSFEEFGSLIKINESYQD
jgi:hypothetical protein